MAGDTRHKDVDWRLHANESGTCSWDVVKVAVLMDIRDELKKLNRLLYCDNFVSVPRILRRISANTSKPRKKVRR